MNGPFVGIPLEVELLLFGEWFPKIHITTDFRSPDTIDCQNANPFTCRLKAHPRRAYVESQVDRYRSSNS